MSATAKVSIVVLAVAAAGVLFFVIQDGGDSNQTSGVEQASTTPAFEEKPAGNQTKPDEPKPKPKPPEVPTIAIEGGQPVGGVAELEFTEGETIRFVVESDVADHIHLHGYDVIQDVAAGGSTEFDVPATITGVFEAELEDSVVPIAEITVEPG